MALAGRAALAMWWDMAADTRHEFEHWHTHEHFPERLGIPGFLRASRWASADVGEGFFVLYELRDADVLGSPAYLERLNAPTPWSTKLMPQHRNMVRCQCRVVASHGGAIGAHMLTMRFPLGDENALRAAVDARAALVREPGIVGLHLLHHEPPAIAAPTQEQRIRGLADRAAEWIVLLAGYDEDAVREAARSIEIALSAADPVTAMHELRACMAAGDPD